MIPEEEYVTFETAKLLRDAGFPQENGYNIDQPFEDLMMWYNRRGFCELGPIDGYYVNAPTQAQAMRWLRDEHRLLIQVNAEPDGLYFSIQDMSDLCYISGFPYLDCEQPTYEAAAEAGIQAACKLIIEE